MQVQETTIATLQLKSCGFKKLIYLASPQHKLTRNGHLLVLLSHNPGCFPAQETSEHSKVCATEIQSIKEALL